MSIVRDSHSLTSVPSSKVGRDRRGYTDEDRYTALAALDLNGGNVYRTAKALDIPRTTIQKWVSDREERRARGAETSAEKERRGDLAAKVESLLHEIIEEAPNKLEKASFSQSMVGFGIGFDKLRQMRSEGDPDPAAELCRLLGINRAQLPDSLELGPGESIPEEFVNLIQLHALETVESPTGHFEPVVQNDLKPTDDPSQDAHVDPTKPGCHSPLDDNEWSIN